MAPVLVGQDRLGCGDRPFDAEVGIVEGKAAEGPGGTTVIVVETPAFAGSQLERRVAAHAAVVDHVADLWQLGASVHKDAPR